MELDELEASSLLEADKRRTAAASVLSCKKGALSRDLPQSSRGKPRSKRVVLSADVIRRNRSLKSKAYHSAVKRALVAGASKEDAAAAGREAHRIVADELKLASA